MTHDELVGLYMRKIAAGGAAAAAAPIKSFWHKNALTKNLRFAGKHPLSFMGKSIKKYPKTTIGTLAGIGAAGTGAGLYAGGVFDSEEGLLDQINPYTAGGAAVGAGAGWGAAKLLGGDRLVRILAALGGAAAGGVGGAYLKDAIA